MHPIDFSYKDNPDHEAQLSFLIRREFFVTYYTYRKVPVYLFEITLVALGFVLFTPLNSLITLKEVVITLLSIAWLIAIIFTIPILYKWLSRYNWKRKTLAYDKHNPSSYKLFFDNEKIIFESATYKTELTWDYYTFWIENKNSLFIFPKNSLYEALYYSKSDIGEENYLALKKIVTEKLTKLDN